MPDTFMDAGPLISLMDRADKKHTACVRLLQTLNCAFYVTLAVLTEAMYMVGKRGGWPAQEAIWRMVRRGDLVIEHPTPADLERMAALMDKYQDNPMDFADASLVALAERLSLTKIMTIDRKDFSSYRILGKKAFTIIGP